MSIWLVVSNHGILFSIYYGIIHPIDFHIFQDGYCTTNQTIFVGNKPSSFCIAYFQTTIHVVNKKT